MPQEKWAANLIDYVTILTEENSPFRAFFVAFPLSLLWGFRGLSDQATLCYLRLLAVMDEDGETIPVNLRVLGPSREPDYDEINAHIHKLVEARLVSIILEETLPTGERFVSVRFHEIPDQAMRLVLCGPEEGPWEVSTAEDFEVGE